MIFGVRFMSIWNTLNILIRRIMLNALGSVSFNNNILHVKVQKIRRETMSAVYPSKTRQPWYSCMNVLVWRGQNVNSRLSTAAYGFNLENIIIVIILSPIFSLSSFRFFLLLSGCSKHFADGSFFFHRVMPSVLVQH